MLTSTYKKRIKHILNISDNMTWHVTTEFPSETYSVEHPVQHLPIDLVFTDRDLAQDLADWLNKKDDWTERLELIIEYETDINLKKLKEG